MKSAGRDEDYLGVAFGVAGIGDDFKDANPGVNHKDELHAEAYYNFKVNDHLAVTPDFQWVDNADGNGDNDSFVVFGVRAQLSF